MSKTALLFAGQGAQYVGMGMSGGDPNGLFDMSVVEEFQDYFLKEGTIQQKLDVTQMADLSYIEYAAQRLGQQ